MIEYQNIIKIEKARLDKVVLPNAPDNIEVYLKREDLIHPAISGNKWYKLKHNLIFARKKNHSTLLTFGGAYSNHIYAVAAAGKLFGFKTIGFIRGEEHLPLNPTLEFASNCGMQIVYIDRTTFRKKDEPEFIEEIYMLYGDVYILPEGGTNKLAVKGVSEIVETIEFDYDYLCCSCGTGGTIAGLISGSKDRKKVLGFSSLKGGEFLNDEIKKLLRVPSRDKNWEINQNYHFGGYAKVNLELFNFVIEFGKLNNIALDYVYTGKMMYGIRDLIQEGYFKKGSRLVAIHTGGIQGNLGMKKKIDRFSKKNG